MRDTFQQIRCPVILLLCFALVFQPQLAALAYGYYESTGRKIYVYTPKLDNIDEVDSQISYTYDELGRLETVKVNKLNGEDADDQTNYYYNEAGSLKGVIYPNGNYAAYSYDAINRLTNLANKNASQEILSSYQYTLAPDGRRTAVTEENSTSGTTTINWTYDSLNRLTKEQYNAPGDANDYSHSYVYDLLGNRLERQVLDGNDTIYHYNNNDQLEQETTDGNNLYYDYDDNGSLIEEANDVSTLQIYSYNLQNRLASVDNGDTIVNYKYNPDGIRVQSAVVDGATTNYLIDQFNHTGYAQVFRANIVDGASTVYVLGNDVLAQATGSDYPDYFLYDGHGSVRQLANYDGTIAENYHYDAYGNLLLHSDTPSTKLLYSGEWRDSHSGWDYLRARWYAPATGRFNRIDDFTGDNRDPQSLHKYLYCHANPIDNIDPSGESSLTETLTVSSIIGAVMGSIVGYIRGGISGALAGLVSGAIFAPLCTLGVLGAGLGIAAMLGISATSGLIVSFALAVTGSLVWSTYELITAKNDRERLAAGVTIIFTLGFAAFGAYRFSKIPGLPNSARGTGALPSSRSAWGEFLSETAALLRGERVVARQVTVKTPSNIRVRVDLVIRTLRGKLKFIDSKFGPSARFTPNQKTAYPEIGQYGGTIQGNNAASAGLPAGTSALSLIN